MKLSHRRKGRSVEERFNDFVIPEPNSGCWIWLGHLSTSGYARFSVNRKLVQANRYSWELHRGIIPEGLYACHTCDNRACVNPEHLFLGTQAENLKDMVRKGRDNPRRGEQHAKAFLTDADVLSIRADQRPLDLIAQNYGVDKSYIWKIKKGWHWAHLPLNVEVDTNRVKNGQKIRAKGVAHPKAKLSEIDVLRIRVNRRPSREVAKLYGITKTTVLAIRNNKIWKHLLCG